MHRAEEVVVSDFSQGSPVDTVRGETDGAVEHEAVGGFLDWAISEDRALENLFGHVRVAGDNGSRVAEAEGHEPGGVK